MPQVVENYGKLVMFTSKTKHQVFSLEFVQVLVHVTQMAPIALFPYTKPFGRGSMFNRLFFTPAGPLVYGQAGVRQAFTAAAGDCSGSIVFLCILCFPRKGMITHLENMSSILPLPSQ